MKIQLYTLSVTNDNKEEIKGLKLLGLLFPARGRLKFLPRAPADLEPALVVVVVVLVVVKVIVV